MMVEVMEAVSIGMVHPGEWDVVNCQGGQDFFNSEVGTSAFPKVHPGQGDGPGQ